MRRIICLIAFALVGHNAWAIDVSPSPSYNGSYTVSWSTTLGCTYNDDPPFYSYQCTSLVQDGVEVATSGYSLPVSGKPVGSYQYYVYYTFYVYGFLYDQGVVEGPVTVNVLDPPPSFSIATAPPVSEGDTMVFTVTRSGTTTGSYSLSYNTYDGSGATATTGADFPYTSGTLTFASGVTSQTISVPTTEDAVYEANEYFYVQTHSPTGGATITSPSTNYGYINNDDAAPSFSINDPSISEGGIVSFTITKSGATQLPHSVSFATATGTAGSSDFTASANTLTFTSGQPSLPVSIQTTQDTVYEGNEQFVLNLSSATNGATISDSQGAGTITDNDTVTFSINDVPIAEGGALAFTVTQTGASVFPHVVSYATANGTATTADGDYTAASGTLSFPPTSNPTQALGVSVTTIDESPIKQEAAETVLVNLGNGGLNGATISDSQGVGTITNDDAVSFTISDVSVVEGGALAFVVTRNGASDLTHAVSYATANGTATTADNDYTAASGSVSFPPSTTPAPTQTVNITTIDESPTKVEASQTVLVNLSNGGSLNGGTIGDSQGVGTITNDDSVSFAVNDVPAAEGTALAFSVTMTGLTELSHTVQYSTANGTATSGSDYTAVSATTLTFSSAQPTQPANVSTTNDSVSEPNETLTVNLTNPGAASVIGDGSGTGTINNNDAPGAPSGLTAPIGITGSSAALTWSAASGHLTHHEVERTLDGAVTTVNTSSSSASYTIGSLTADGTYYFRVRACNSQGGNYCGAWSNTTQTVRSSPDTTTGAPPAHDTTTSGDAGPSTGLTSFNGIVSGNAAVAPSGAATYSIPIAIPPGTRGMQPSLALVYNSHAGNGTLGRGWSLAGAGSAITRCGLTKAQDDTIHAVDYTSFDRFCLDGQRLVLSTSGAFYGGNFAHYRTEIESFRDIVSTGGTNSSPDAFTVRTRDGSTLTYGGTAGSKFNANGPNSTEVAAWLLRRVEDLFGNFYTITYFEDEANGHYHVERIDYTGHTAAPALPTYASVEFTYDAVANPIKQYRAGSVTSVRQRLRKITAKNGTSAVREYVLAYNENETVPVSGMARLTSVKECAPTEAGPCTAPTTFDWIDEVGGMLATGSLNTLPGGYQEWVDLNGDNRADFVNFSTADGLQQTVQLSNGTAFASPQTWTKGSSTNTNYKFADVDGDGDADFVSFGTATGDHLVSRSNGVNGYLPTVAWPAHVLMSGGHVFTDMNADGRTDFVTWQNTGDPDENIDYFVSLSTGSGYTTQTWSGPKLDGTPGWDPDSHSFHDVNSDGRTDLVLVKAGEHRIYVNNGSGFDPYFQVTAGWYSEPHGWADVNGDSLLDYVVPGNPNHLVSLWTGKGYVNEVWTGTPFVSQAFWRDMNGDGLADYFSGSEVGLSTGSGYVTSPAWSPFSGPDQNNEYPDIDGDGKPDIKGAYYPTVGYGINQSQPVHLMRKVTDGLGMETVFTYEPVSNPSIHTKLTNATYPISDFANAVHVVSHVAQSSGSSDGDGYFDTDYRYKGFKVDLSGRGSLGFAEVTAIDLDRKIQTVTTYSQTYPSTGFPTSVDVTVTDKLDNGGNSPQLISDNDRVYVARNSVTSFEFAQIKFVCLDTDTTVEKDVKSGANLRTTLIDNDPGNSTMPCDVYGNPGQLGTADPTHGTPLVRRLTVTDHVSGVAYRTDTATYYVDAVGLGLGKLPKRQFVQPFVNGVGDATKDRTTAISYVPNKDEVLEIVREPDQAAPIKLTTTFEYDAFGNRKKETITPSEGGAPPNPPVRIERVDFDSIGRFPATLTNAKSQITTLTFDARFGAIATIDGPNATVSGFNDLVTRAYDAFGRLSYELRPDGSYEVASYLSVAQSPAPTPSGTTGLSPRPKVVVETGVQNTAPGTTPTVRQTPIRTFLDALGRVQRNRARAFDDTNFVHSDTVYDSRGRVKQRSELYYDGQAAVWNTPDYDVLGRVEGVVAADSTQSTTTDYDGFTVTTTDAGGRKNRLISDALGRPTRSEDLNSASSVLAVVEYLYDKAGNLETTQKRTPGNTVIPNTTITNVYDRLGRRTRTTDRDLTGNVSTSYTDFQYDSLGDLRKQQTPLLRAQSTSLYTEFKFDELGRLTERKDPSNNLTATVTSTFTYDQTLAGCEAGVGQLTKEEIGGGGEVGLVTDYCYSPVAGVRGRLANEKRTTSGTTYQTNFTYDAIGRLSQLRYPASSAAYPSRFAVNYKYNPRGYLQRVEQDDNSAVLYQTLGANARGQIEKSYLGDGSRTTNNYIKNTDRLAFTNAASGASNVQNFVYTYDTIANISGRADLINSVSETFGYDAVDRLTSSTVTNSTGTKPTVYYDYDTGSLGNLTHKSDITTAAAPSMTYSTTGRPHAVESLNTGAGTRTFTYNLNGAMTGGQVDSATRTIAWTSYDLPASITIGTTSRTFSYGPDRARYRQVSVAGAITRTYTYVGEHFVKEVEGSSTEYKLYFTANGEQVGYVSDDGTPEVRYFHKDHLGSITTIVTNQNVAGREKLSYDAWGKRRSGTDWFSAAAAASEERGYTGHEHLDNVNLIHMNGRLLDPTLGRVISADPFISDPLYSQSYNRFSYVYNNPLRRTDPTGFSGCCDENPRPPPSFPPGPQIPYPNPLPPHCFNPGQVYCWFDGQIHDNPFTEEYLNAMFPPEPPPAPLPRTPQAATDTKSLTPTVSGALWDIGAGVVLAGAGFVPYVGDALDGYDLVRPSASTTDRAIAGTSLAINAWTAGLAPNAGPIVRGGRRVGSGVGDLYRASKDSIASAADSVKNGVRSTVDRVGGWARNLMGGCGCFVAGTLVATSMGLTPIEDIDVGDQVWARDEQTGELALKPVTALIRPSGRVIWKVTFQMDEGTGADYADFEVTDDHPWGSIDGTWVRTDELKPGMEIQRAHGVPARVVSVTQAERAEQTYNLEVSDFHTYFVGKGWVWVHNAKPCAPAPDFDTARRDAFEHAQMTDPNDVEFSKYDPETGTVVEFKGPNGAKVGYDGPHSSPGPNHDTQHISAQEPGKRSQGEGLRRNFPYSGPQHPSRSDRK